MRLAVPLLFATGISAQSVGANVSRMQLLDTLAAAWTVVVVPLVVLPRLLSVSRARIALATGGGIVLWLAGYYIVFSALLSAGIALLPGAG
ncbi:MAG: hypothetical protein NVSMB64_31410 [Candidatus Velthaea sp.]